jgi:hypothetical protein
MFFDFLFTRSSKFHVFDLLTWVSCWVLSRLFLYIFPSYQQIFIPYILLMYSTLCNIFHGMSLFS